MREGGHGGILCIYHPDAGYCGRRRLLITMEHDFMFSPILRVVRPMAIREANSSLVSLVSFPANDYHTGKGKCRCMHEGPLIFRREFCLSRPASGA
jgi:hypothetical protein